ncbi:hypothetical protein ARMSODRAFT_540099 [Armillaria solidipes]|uniref:Uroporphyrinogen-III synthase n=1 Tax=Armillaria solidipes TaxID=1076256 RepID=A0A2H3BHJ7_9AGAR|nr:hypothetical protein ARMSODRAFT_540099 [Armillaria solidipes]
MTAPSLQQNTRLSRFQCETRLTKITELAPATALSNFDGIITTGARSYDAWVEENSTGKDGFPFYVVGKDTASMLRPIAPDADIHEKSSTTAELLADFILAVERNCDRPAQELPRILPRCTGHKAALLSRNI